MRLTVDDFPPLTAPGRDAAAAKGSIAAGATSAVIPATSNGTAAATAAENGDSDEVVRVLRECQGNVGKAAKTLGMHRSTLYRRLEKLGIQVNT
jgi:transcriptional regulator of acetoin/glycerol metabolism